MKQFVFWFFIFSLSFFIFFASGFVDSQDGFQYLAIARRIYYDKTVAMPEERFPEANIHMNLAGVRDDVAYSPTGIGYSLALLPAVALEHLFLLLSGAQPTSAFPLHNDWPVLLFASMTNSLFGAAMVVTMYLYLRSFELKHRFSVVLSFGTIVSTYLFAYTKHTFAHQMFNSFLLLAFFAIRKRRVTEKSVWMFWAGLATGVVMIAYNMTAIFTFPALAIYYLCSTTSQWNLRELFFKQRLTDLFFGLSGFMPWVMLYIYFNYLRFSGVADVGYTYDLPLIPPAYVMIEGFWGLLFSPGKSVFLFAPPLLILVLFWHKFKKEWLPEALAFTVLAATYFYFIGTLLGDVDFPIWHGESSWGPRYLTPIVAPLMVMVALLSSRVSKFGQKFVLAPIFFLGLVINTVGASLPYQIRFAGLEVDAQFNGRNFTVYEYGNEIPRYSPVFSLTKKVVKRLKNLSDVYDHGTYNLRLYDGFEYPFIVGTTAWREILPLATFSFKSTHDIDSIELHVRNHQIELTSTRSAELQFATLENQKLASMVLPAGSEEVLRIENPKVSANQENHYSLHLNWIGTESAQLKKKQVLFLQALYINGQPQNIRTLDYPYVSDISRGLDTSLGYRYWGNEEQDLWALWHMHSGIFEQTFDFWWLRPLHYWDMPKQPFIVLFVANTTTLLYAGLQLRKYFFKQDF